MWFTRVFSSHALQILPNIFYVLISSMLILYVMHLFFNGLISYLRSSKEAELNIKKALEKGVALPTEDRFDSNCITPGM